MNANEHAKSKAQRGCKQKMPTDTVVGESERKKRIRDNKISNKNQISCEI